MVYCGVTPPYPSLAHPTEGDDLGKGSRYCDALGSYTKRHKNIDWVGAGTVTTGQSDDAARRYGEG
jgi:hypothetical protein